MEWRSVCDRAGDEEGIMGERRGCAWPGGYDEGQGKQLRHSRRGVGRERSSPESDEPGAGVAMMITPEGVEEGRFCCHVLCCPLLLLLLPLAPSLLPVFFVSLCVSCSRCVLLNFALNFSLVFLLLS